MSGADQKKAYRGRLLLLAAGLAALCVVLAIMMFTLLPGWGNTPPLAEVEASASRYDEAVRLIAAGEIPDGSANGEMVALPPEYRELSPARDGEVIIYRQGSAVRVLFYLHGTTSSSTWVYMYSSDDTPMDLHGECSGTKRERPNWFFFHCP